MDDDSDDTATQRVREAVAAILQERRAGEKIDADAAAARHPDIAAQLRSELAKYDFNTEATDIASPTPSFSGGDAASPSTIDIVHSPTHDGPDPRGSQPHTGPAAGAELNRFAKVRCHAAGGMGEVWVAHDTQIRREVALKLLRKERKGDQSIHDRFLNEGLVTGALEHPGIVPVYALGVDAQHEPYYAMRFVRGESLRHAIKTFHAQPAKAQLWSRSNLALRQLLRRVADVCMTIAFAHSRGVLHRDLKPDNVMLGKFGETYVVDWGMARVLESPDDEISVAAQLVGKSESLHADSGTRYGSAMGTPGFMSPEQAAGKLDELSKSTDIYSLGAILYFLLTNHVSISADTLPDFLRRVEASDFPPPQSLNPYAPRELCAACGKAMAHRPADRYGAAQEMAADIERWLADEPMIAAPESLLQKAGRFGRRHARLLIPLITAAALTTVIATTAAISINNSRRRAEKNFLDARDTVDQWLTGFSEGLAYYPGVDAFRQQMLQQAAARYEQFVAQAGDDPVVQLEAGRTYLRLGDLRRHLRTFDKSKTAYDAAAKVFERLVQQSGEFEAREGLAQTYGRIAVVYDDQGDSEPARTFHDKAIALANEVASASAANDSKQRVAAGALLSDLEINYAAYLARHGQMQESAKAFAGVVSRLKQLAQEEPGRLETRTSLATAMLGWGQVIARLGDSNKARELYKQAAAYFEGAAQLADETPRYVKMRADANLLLATAERMLGDSAAESSAYLEIIEAYETLNAQLPNVPEFQESLALTQVDLGQLSLEVGQTAAAKPVLNTALATYEYLSSLAPSHSPFQEGRGLALDLVSGVHAAEGDLPEAVAVDESALAVLQELANARPEIPAYQVRASVCQSHLAQLRAADAKFDEAEKEFAAAGARLDAAIAQHPDDPTLQHAAAVVASRRGESLALAGDGEHAAQQADIADQHWQKLVLLSTDAKYLADAAWHYATFPIAAKRSAEHAGNYARSAAKQSPKNAYYVALIALAELAGNRNAECLTRLRDLDKGDQTPFSTAVALFTQCKAHAALANGAAAKTAYQAGVAEMESGQKGRWELLTLRRQCDESLKSTAAAQK